MNNFNPSAPPNKDPLIGDILTSSGTSLGLSDDDSGSGTASTLIFTPSASDTYFIVVTPQGPNDVGGWWTLAVNDFVAPPDDFGNALDPSNPISLWETQDGHIGTNGDTDTIAISLQAGVAVDITLYGNDVGFFGELADTEIVSFVDSMGVAVNPAFLDTATAISQFTSGVGVDAHQLSFTPTQTGIYYLTVGAGPGEATGDYSVSVSAKDRGIFSVRENELFIATGNPEIDAFFIGGLASNVDHIYSDRDGDGVTTLTFSVPGANPGFSAAIHNVINSEWTNGYAPASGPVLDTYFDVTSQISSFSNIEFVQVADTGVEAGTFRIGDTDIVLGSASGALVTGWSGFPKWMMAGETWINRDKGAENTAIIQNFGAAAVTLENFLINRTLHEFTHNLGLNHPDQSSLAGGIDPKFHGQAYSVMSRTSSGEFPDALVGDLFPQTLMWLDIQAIQAAYGVDTVTTAGADTYTFDTDERNFSTVWDYGGVDTLVLTGAADTVIKLKSGVWQDVGTSINYYGNTGSVVAVDKTTVFIAPGTDIENVQGGGGNDHLSGSLIANDINGGDGADTLEGGGSADTLNGGAGFDTASYENSVAAVDVSLLSGTGAGAAASGDVLSEIEALTGSAFDDQFIGSNIGNILDGAAGHDNLDGQRGNDTLIGGAGDDTLNGGKGRDVIIGGSGFDVASYANATGGVHVELWSGLGVIGEAVGDQLSGIDALTGSSFNDKLTGSGAGDRLDGGGGHDRLWGSGGGDVINGDAGNDFVNGQRGNDTLNGGLGNDTLDGGKGRDAMDGGVGFDTASYAKASGGVHVELWSGLGVIGEAAGDFLSGIEAVIGSSFNDKLTGDGAANMIDGGSGNDRLWASGGDDTLIGGGENDLLKGQGGDDVMNGGAGLDTLDGAAGDDTFQFDLGGGADRFIGFTAGAATDDLIELIGFGPAFDTFAEVIAAATQNGADTVIDLGGGDVITLENVTIATLHSDDFLFS